MELIEGNNYLVIRDKFSEGIVGHWFLIGTLVVLKHKIADNPNRCIVEGPSPFLGCAHLSQIVELADIEEL